MTSQQEVTFSQQRYIKGKGYGDQLRFVEPLAVVNGGTGASDLSTIAVGKLTTARTIALSGGATGTATSFDGSANIAIPVTALNPTSLSAAVGLSKGGTGATTASAARTALGVAYSDDVPVVNGTATAGVGTTISRFDHVHPIDARTKYAIPGNIYSKVIAYDVTRTKDVMSVIYKSDATTDYAVETYVDTGTPDETPTRTKTVVYYAADGTTPLVTLVFAQTYTSHTTEAGYLGLVSEVLSSET